MSDAKPIVEVKDLTTYFDLDEGTLKAVDGVSFTVRENRVLGIVGESGCGKSVTAQAIMRIVPKPGRISGNIIYHREDGTSVDLAEVDDESETVRALRGNRIAMIFQEPMTAFSPVHTVGNQLIEAHLVHGRTDEAAARKEAIELLDRVGIPAPDRRIDEYTFQFSGGMRQRAMIAMAMMNRPRMLIADEPTTALDVTIQAQILRLLKDIQLETGMGIMFITHDLGVIANMADDVVVMYRGKIVESGPVRDIFRSPSHPYTRALMQSIPKFSETTGRLKPIRGTVGIPIDPPNECPFVSRCDYVIEGVCSSAMPPETRIDDGHSVWCYLHGGHERVTG